MARALFLVMKNVSSKHIKTGKEITTDDFMKYFYPDSD